MGNRLTATRATTVLVVAGLVAYATGVSKRWVLSPIGDAFGDLAPNGKVIVTALIVVGTIVLIALSRHTRRTAVTAARRRIDEAHGTGR